MHIKGCHFPPYIIVPPPSIIQDKNKRGGFKIRTLWWRLLTLRFWQRGSSTCWILPVNEGRASLWLARRFAWLFVTAMCHPRSLALSKSPGFKAAQPDRGLGIGSAPGNNEHPKHVAQRPLWIHPLFQLFYVLLCWRFLIPGSFTQIHTASSIFTVSLFALYGHIKITLIISLYLHHSQHSLFVLLSFLQLSHHLCWHQIKTATVYG